MSKKFTTPKMTFGDTLRFTPYSFAKLIYMRDKGPTEVAGYGVTGTEDPLLVTDFILIKQKCTGASFDFDSEDMADYAERMMDIGMPPWTCQNILLHSHPGNCPQPSGTDEENFRKAFSHPYWAIMFIIARGGEIYCRLKINVGPGVVKELKIAVDWNVPFNGSNIEAWNNEYKDKVQIEKFCMTGKEGGITRSCLVQDDKPDDDPLWWNKKYEQLARQQDELNRVEELDFDCHWDDNGYAAFFEYNDALWYFYDPIEKRWFSEDAFGENRNDIVAINKPIQKWSNMVVAWAEENL
jgi:proteasome lid subunit RPN8/RPN11